MTDEMAAAYERDHAGQARMRDLRLAIIEFLTDPPARTSDRTHQRLEEATVALQEDMYHIDGVWD